MKKKYIENPEFNYEKVNRASTACGPMVKWAIAQVRSLMLTLALLVFAIFGEMMLSGLNRVLQLTVLCGQVIHASQHGFLCFDFLGYFAFLY